MVPVCIVIPSRSIITLPLHHSSNQWPYRCSTGTIPPLSGESLSFIVSRHFHISLPVSAAEGSKSKVEEAVSAVREKLSQQTETKIFDVVKPEPVKPKKSLWTKIVHEVKHYYHGFRLLFIDIKVSSKLVWRLLRGKMLTRREHKLLVRTTSDLFRLVPFSVFIIVPFMEFLLPVFLKFFPGMLPSTFQTENERDMKIKQKLKLKLEMAKFLQNTLGEMSLQSSSREKSDKAKEFGQFFEKIRETGQQASNADILQFSKLFEDELTLDSLSRDQLIALVRLLELQPYGTNNFLRFQLRMKLRHLKADDEMIKKEGVDNLNIFEVQQACRARGMRALGIPEERLRSQLSQWLDLSLNEKIPPSLLLLSRALYLPEHLPATDQLAATISSLSESAATQAEAKIAELEGTVDNKIRLQLIKEEEQKIREEKEEARQQLAQKKVEEALSEMKVEADLLLDKAPVLEEKEEVKLSEAEKKKMEEISPADIDEIEDALANISAEKKKLLMIEKEELEDLKEEMAEYNEDIEELKDVMVQTGETEERLRESKAARRLKSQVGRMIGKMDKAITKMEKSKKPIEEKIEEGKAEQASKDELVSIDELLQALTKLQKTPDDTKMKKIYDVLSHMDIDQDGNIEVDDVIKVLDLMSKEHENITSRQLREVIEMLDKEENLELVKKLEKLMAKEQAVPVVPPKDSEAEPLKDPSVSQTIQDKSSEQRPPS